MLVAKLRKSGSDSLNPYKQAWMDECGLIYQSANPTTPVQANTSDMSGHIGGAATLAGTYAASYLMLRSGNPALMATGAGILLVPDPIIYGIGYWIFD